MLNACILPLVQPIHTIQALNNPNIMLLGIEQVGKLVCAANYQNGARARSPWIVVRLDTQS